MKLTSEQRNRLNRQYRKQCTKCWRPRHPESFALCYVHLLEDRLRKRKVQGYTGRRGRPAIPPMSEVDWVQLMNETERHTQ